MADQTKPKKKREANKFADSKNAEDLLQRQERLEANIGEDEEKKDKVAVKVSKGDLKGLKNEKVKSNNNALLVTECEGTEIELTNRVINVTLQSCSGCVVTVYKVMSEIVLIDCRDITLIKIGEDRASISISKTHGVTVDCTDFDNPSKIKMTTESSTGVKYITKNEGPIDVPEAMTHKMVFYHQGVSTRVQCEFGLPRDMASGDATEVNVNDTGAEEVNLIKSEEGADLFMVTITNCKGTKVTLPGNCSYVRLVNSNEVSLYAAAVANLEQVSFVTENSNDTKLYAKPEDDEIEVPFPTTYAHSLVDGAIVSSIAEQ